MPTHFSEDPPQVMNQADLDVANERLNERDSSKDNSEDERHTTDGNGEKLDRLGTYDKHELTEEECYKELGFGFPSAKKWYILTVIFIVQVRDTYCR